MKLYPPPARTLRRQLLLQRNREEREKEGRQSCMLPVVLQVYWSLPVWEPRLAPAAQGGVWLVPRPRGLDWAGWGDWRQLPSDTSIAPGVGRVLPSEGGACGVESNLGAQKEAGSGAGGARSPSRQLSQSRAQAQPGGGGGNRAQGSGRSPRRQRRRQQRAARKLE